MDRIRSDQCAPETNENSSGTDTGTAEAESQMREGTVAKSNISRRKDRFVSPTAEERVILTELLVARLKEGNFETFCDIGAGDDESEENGLSHADVNKSLDTLRSIADSINAKVMELKRRQDKGGEVAEVLVRTTPAGDDFVDIRVAVVGNVDAGKSTLLGVLTHDELDNGRGRSRQKLFKHAHEAESGRTSAVSLDILGFSSDGKIVNKPGHDGTLDWTQICSDAAKVLTFIDLAGHEKYLKTTVFGLTGHMPSFVMLLVGANAGVIGMAKEHLGLALALNKPVLVVVTKIDMCPPNVLEATLKLLHRILKSPGCKKMPMLIKTQDDMVDASRSFQSQRVCPIFQVSNVTGENLNLLKQFLNLLRPSKLADPHAPAEVQLDETFSVPGTGTVVSGTCVNGTIRTGDSLMLGPDSTGGFQLTNIRGIHRRRMPTGEVRGGQAASFSLKKVKRSQIRKGMVLVHPSLNPKAHWEFDGEIVILHHPTTITTKYQAMVHVGSVRQSAAILHIDGLERLRTGDKAHCRFRFVRFPEYITKGARIVFREGRTKAVGTILRLVPPEEEMARGLTMAKESSRTTALVLAKARATVLPAATKVA